MKKLFLTLSAIAMATFFTACGSDEPTPDPAPTEKEATVTIEAGEAGETAISFTITSTNATEVKYLVSTEATGVTLEQIKGGKSATANTAAKLTENELTAETDYFIYAAASNSEQKWTLAKSVKMTTKEGGVNPEPNQTEEVTFEVNLVSATASSDGSYINIYITDKNSNNMNLVVYNASQVVLDGTYPSMPTDQTEDGKWLNSRRGQSYISYNGDRYDLATEGVEDWLIATPIADSMNPDTKISFSITTSDLKYRFVGEADCNLISDNYTEIKREMDHFNRMMVDKRGNNFTVKLNYTGTLTLNIADNDGVLGANGYETYSIADNTLSGHLLESGDGDLRLTLSEGSITIIDNNDGTYSFYIDDSNGGLYGTGTDTDGNNFRCQFFHTSKAGWKATVIEYNDADATYETVNFTPTNVTVENGEGDVKIITATDKDNNKAYLYAHSVEGFDYLYQGTYYIVTDAAMANLLYGLTLRTWIDVTKSYIEWGGTKYELQQNLRNNSMEVTTQMPYADQNTLKLSAVDSETKKRFAIDYTGAFNYGGMVEKIELTMTSFKHTKISDSEMSFTITDDKGTELYLYLHDGVITDYAKVATYYFAAKYEDAQNLGASNNRWADTAKSYIKYGGETYTIQENNSSCWFKVPKCGMPTTNSSRFRLAIATADGSKEFSFDQSDVVVDGYVVE